MATHVLTELAGYATEPLPFKGNRKMYERLWNYLHGKESSRNEKGQR